jgi:hypothetical protein
MKSGNEQLPPTHQRLLMFPQASLPAGGTNHTDPPADLILTGRQFVLEQNSRTVM